MAESMLHSSSGKKTGCAAMCCRVMTREAAAAGMPVPAPLLTGRTGDQSVPAADAAGGGGSSSTGRKRGRSRAAGRDPAVNDADDEGTGYRGAQ